MAVLEVWSEALGVLETIMNRPAYELLAKKIVPVDISDNNFHIKVTGSFAGEYLNEYKRSIEDTLSSITSRDMSIIAEFVEEADPEPITDRPAVFMPTVESVKTQPRPKTTLNDMYTFDSFVVGDSNQFCYNTSRAVAEKPGSIANPLFIYGDVGLGKTHLLHAIGNYVLESRPDLHVVHRHAAAFINDMMNHIRDGRLVDFRNQYLNADLFLIDDIHNLRKMVGTQNEFFQLFNAFYENKKQIVVTCDRPPKELNELEDRIVSRLGWGVIADIQTPNFETRHAILSKKLETESLSGPDEFPDEVLSFIAERITTNIRDLEGALMSIMARAKYNNQRVTRDLAEEIMNNIAPQRNPREISPEMIIREVSSYFDVPEEEILGTRRKKEVVQARMVAMFLIREITKMPFISIGEVFGKDHSTVLYAQEKIEKEVKKDSSLKSSISSIRDKITG